MTLTHLPDSLTQLLFALPKFQWAIDPLDLGCRALARLGPKDVEWLLAELAPGAKKDRSWAQAEKLLRELVDREQSIGDVSAAANRAPNAVSGDEREVRAGAVNMILALDVDSREQEGLIRAVYARRCWIDGDLYRVGNKTLVDFLVERNDVVDDQIRFDSLTDRVEALERTIDTMRRALSAQQQPVAVRSIETRDRGLWAEVTLSTLHGEVYVCAGVPDGPERSSARKKGATRLNGRVWPLGDHLDAWCPPDLQGRGGDEALELVTEAALSAWWAARGDEPSESNEQQTGGEQ